MTLFQVSLIVGCVVFVTIMFLMFRDIYNAHTDSALNRRIARLMAEDEIRESP